VILGRDLAVQRAEVLASDRAPTLYVQPLTAPDSFVERFDWQGDKPNDDLLSEWWGNVEVRGYDTPFIPTGIKAGQAIQDLKEYPVTNALLARYLVENWMETDDDGDITFLFDLDRATLYHEILKGLHARDWGVLKGTRLNALTEFNAFMIFLEDVALACFQDDTRTASLSAVEAALSDPQVTAGLRKTLVESDSLPDQALMAFHVRLATVDGEERLEFTHKSFADYLLARRLLRAARDSEDVGGWGRRFGQFRIQMEVVDFLRPEAVRQHAAVEMDLVSGRRWLADILATTVGTGFPTACFSDSNSHLSTSSLAYGVADAELAVLGTLDAVCRALDTNGSTERAIVYWLDQWAAWRMIARQFVRSTGVHGQPDQHGRVDPALECLSRLVYSADSSSRVGDDEWKEGEQSNSTDALRLTLHNACLFGVDFDGAKLRGIDLSGADLRCARLRHADLEGANLRHADLSRADLRFSNLKYADLTGANLENADLEHFRITRDRNLWR
jgi:hypothetical protein